MGEWKQSCCCGLLYWPLSAGLSLGSLYGPLMTGFGSFQYLKYRFLSPRAYPQLVARGATPPKLPVPLAHFESPVEPEEDHLGSQSLRLVPTYVQFLALTPCFLSAARRSFSRRRL